MPAQKITDWSPKKIVTCSEMEERATSVRAFVSTDAGAMSDRTTADRRIQTGGTTAGGESAAKHGETPITEGV